MTLTQVLSVKTAALLLTVASTGVAGDCCGSCEAAGPKNLVDTAVAAGSFKTLVAAVQAADLADTLSGAGPFTVLAPSDQAFAKLPKRDVEALLRDKDALRAVLTYHVLPGRVPASKVASMQWAKTAQGQSVRVRAADGAIRIDGATVIAADIPASNGIIHVVDTVLMPRKDIVETAVGAGSFQTLVAAVNAARLAETLKGEGPFTVFAPADPAFSKLPAGAVDALLKDDARLKAVLTYHVVPGRILAGDIAAGSSRVRTASGLDLRIERSKAGPITVNGAKVILSDIVAGNGIIHVVDSVLLPPQG
jgi:transforming growth factor-beta-induced protein